jgi:mRNA interferase MazF
VAIVQADSFNDSRIQTVVVAAITSNADLAAAPGNVLLSRRQSRLPKDSVLNVSQLLTIDRSFLDKRISRLSPKVMEGVDKGLRLALGL